MPSANLQRAAQPGLSVLVVHNKYQQPGGEDAVVQAELQLLCSMDAQVVPMIYDSHDAAKMQALQKHPYQLVFNRNAYDEARAHIRRHNIEVVHCHNLVPLLSTSIYAAAAAEHVPVVQTVHNYRISCLNGLHLYNGSPCERCRPGQHVPGMVLGCYRESRVQSVAFGAAQTLNYWRGAWQEPTLYIAPCQSVRQKLLGWGIDKDTVTVKPHFVSHDPGQRSADGGDYAIFVGRLSAEKGVDLLLNAWSSERIGLVIVGDGPLREQLEQLAKTKGLHNVRFVGHQDRANVNALLRQARFLVMPSQWLEIFGLVQIEAYAHGVPVVATRLGAMADIVEDGVTGLLFEPHNLVDLAQKLTMMEGDAAKVKAMGQAARRAYETRYSSDSNAQQLRAIYAHAIARRNKLQHAASG